MRNIVTLLCKNHCTALRRETMSTGTPDYFYIPCTAYVLAQQSAILPESLP